MIRHSAALELSPAGVQTVPPQGHVVEKMMLYALLCHLWQRSPGTEVPPEQVQCDLVENPAALYRYLTAHPASGWDPGRAQAVRYAVELALEAVDELGLPLGDGTLLGRVRELAVLTAGEWRQEPAGAGVQA